MRRALLLIVLCATACGGAAGEVGTLRFHNAPPVWRVNDRVDTPARPAERRFAKLLYHFDGFFLRSLTRAMEVQPARRAANVNALDEVPDSTWFTNRIGVRDMTVDEIRRGPGGGDSPEQHRPWTITGTKVGGVSVGFVMKDARGVRYLLKFDDVSAPEMETAADVIVQRLLWACGYNVPEDDIVYFRREDLVLADDAEVKDFFGNKRPMTLADLEDNLAKVYIEPDGRIRGLVSKFLAGVPIGGYSREGRRADDPNDHFPHELRREVRGQYPIFSWLLHTDVKEDNTLDMWHTDEADPERQYVMHYLVDFGKALGVLGYLDEIQGEGFHHVVDFPQIGASLLSGGLWVRPWEAVRWPSLRGVGIIESERYDPGGFHTHAPYFALEDADRFDGFWGAKILIRFTPEMLRAVVDEARLSDPRAARYLTRVLIERQRKTARYWFRRVAPLDRFEVAATRAGGGFTLCFDDLMLTHALDERAIDTAYRARAFDYHGAPTGWNAAYAPAPAGRSCLPDIRPGAAEDGYTIVRIAVERDRGRHTVDVHLAADSGGTHRVIGIDRH